MKIKWNRLNPGNTRSRDSGISSNLSEGFSKIRIIYFKIWSLAEIKRSKKVISEEGRYW